MRSSANMTYGKAGTRALVAYGLCSSIGISAFTYNALLEKRLQKRPIFRRALEAVWYGSSAASSSEGAVWQVGSSSISEDSALAVAVGSISPVVIGYIAGGLRRCAVDMSVLQVATRRPLLGLVLAPFTLVGSVGGVIVYKLLM